MGSISAVGKSTLVQIPVGVWKTFFQVFFQYIFQSLTVYYVSLTVKQRNPCYMSINLNCITTSRVSYVLSSIFKCVGGRDELTSRAGYGPRAVVW